MQYASVVVGLAGVTRWPPPKQYGTRAASSWSIAATSRLSWSSPFGAVGGAFEGADAPGDGAATSIGRLMFGSGTLIAPLATAATTTIATSISTPVNPMRKTVALLSGGSGGLLIGAAGWPRRVAVV